MRKVSITVFRANMAREFKALPFALTKDGKVFAEVHAEGSYKVCTEPEKSVQSKVVPITKSVHSKNYVKPSDQFFRPMPKTGKKPKG